MAKKLIANGPRAKEEMQWFVVRTRPRQESLAYKNLQQQGYQVLSPFVSLRKRRSGKWQKVLEPMFPGYLFIQLTLGKDDPSPIRSTKGCLGLVRFGELPQPIPPAVIRPLIKLKDLPAEAKLPLKLGGKVRFEGGPFESLDAIYKLPKGEDRAQVLLTIMGRENLVTVEMAQISSVD
jgi:transcriptional antiterminator RfaH